MKNVRIVIADPEVAFREACATLLRQQGYSVTTSTSLEDVKQLLDQQWFHLAILSVQMVSPDDPRDQSGLDFVRERRAILHVLVSHFPSYELMREVMRVGRDDTPRLVDFLEKKEIRFSLDTITRMIDELIPINWQLHIRLLNRITFLQVAQQIYFDADYITLIDYAAELEDLFRKVFYHSQQITLKKVFVQKNLSIVIQTFVNSTDAEERVAVVIDSPLHIDREKYLNARTEKTTHFQAMVVQVAEEEKMVSFREWYTTQSLENISKSLNGLFQGALTQSPQESTRKLNTIERFYNELSYSTLDARIKSLCQEAMTAGLAQLTHHGRKLSLYLSHDTTLDYPNPILSLQEQVASKSTLWFGTIHDHLNIDSTLLWSDNNVRLLSAPNGSNSSPIHNLAMLELSLHLDMAPNLGKRLEALTYLFGSSTRDAVFSIQSVPSELQRTVTVIDVVRHFATTSSQSYYEILFFAAMTHLAGYDPGIRHISEELVDYVHVLLIAAMLVQRQNRLDQLPDNAPADARQTLWLDLDSRKVWVEGVHIAVTPQEFDILKYLYLNVGKTCSREAILREALGDDVDNLFVEQSRLDSAMSRLRLKLELNPKQPRYLHTVRGYGYQLSLDS